METTNSIDMHEQGLVRAVKGGMAQVETVQSEACHQCNAQAACHGMGGARQRLVWALNQAQAQEGDRVLLALPRKGVLGAGFLVYILPILILILGAALGQRLGPAWGWNPTNAAVLLGMGGLVVSWFFLRWLSKRLAGRKEFTVRLVKVFKSPDQAGSDDCH
ncbi:MAG: SoxR reducing system RseC family protein [Desulfarculaceae bacterium]|jgi:sigma-E factor negative regulatory protein RseC